MLRPMALLSLRATSLNIASGFRFQVPGVVVVVAKASAPLRKARIRAGEARAKAKQGAIYPSSKSSKHVSIIKQSALGSHQAHAQSPRAQCTKNAGALRYGEWSRAAPMGQFTLTRGRPWITFSGTPWWRRRRCPLSQNIWHSRLRTSASGLHAGGRAPPHATPPV